MLKIKSDCLFPISDPPIPDGVVILSDDGVIIEVINPTEIDYAIEDVQYYSGIICPGFINTHCHLELSYLKNKIDPDKGLNDFIIQLKSFSDSDKDFMLQSIAEMDELMFRQGVSAVADISNTVISIDVKVKSKIHYYNFIELFGSDPNYSDLIFNNGKKILNEFVAVKGENNTSITPHSLYAVSDILLQNISLQAEQHNTLFSLHHLESLEEKDFFFSKSGTVVERMKLYNVDISNFNASGKSSLETLCHYLPLNSNTLLVHNIYANSHDIKFAMNHIKNLWWCLCPNSNLFIEKKLPDLNLFIKNNCRLTIGTDSLASNNALSILNELITLQKNFKISTQELLKIATLNGAEFMRIVNSFGSISKNKKPGLVLIKNINPENFFFTEKSESIRII